MVMRTQRGYRTRDRDPDQIAKEAKRRRRNTAGRWVAGKGDDLVNKGASKGIT